MNKILQKENFLPLIITFNNSFIKRIYMAVSRNVSCSKETYFYERQRIVKAKLQ